MANAPKAKIAKKDVLEDRVVFNFADGTILDCCISEVSKEMLITLAVHGLSQKVGDEYAGAGSIIEAHMKASGLWESIKAGVFNPGGNRGNGGKIVEALARATGRGVAEALEAWRDMEPEAQKAMRKHPQIVKALAEMEVERLAALPTIAMVDAPDLNALYK